VRTSYSPGAIWAMVAVIGVGTWLLRLSFVAILARVETVPPAVTRVLRLIPAAVLAAITAPAITNAGGSFDLTTVRFAAGALAGLVAWRTRNVAATIGVGMAALWVLEGIT
jgi:branched-subunit amino acid transport protein